MPMPATVLRIMSLFASRYSREPADNSSTRRCASVPQSVVGIFPTPPSSIIDTHRTMEYNPLIALIQPREVAARSAPAELEQRQNLQWVPATCRKDRKSVV